MFFIWGSFSPIYLRSPSLTTYISTVPRISTTIHSSAMLKTSYSRVLKCHNNKNKLLSLHVGNLHWFGMQLLKGKQGQKIHIIQQGLKWFSSKSCLDGMSWNTNGNKPLEIEMCTSNAITMWENDIQTLFIYFDKLNRCCCHIFLNHF